ncbi:Gibberellin-regulated protein 14 [Striga hermonthica]|uniref:Gibberellin-regulated protein 14 n=1 Tax=Striga hermonthica TaxID=68872 RepID=A0A9N7NA37_STRHE|nr:Gibberellin-regulated protein 14 [Striga hermonthica]
MATKLVLALIFSLLYLLQVSSDPRNINGETNHASQALHMLSRGERKLMHKFYLDVSKYIYNPMISRALAFAPAPSPSPSLSLDCNGLCQHRCSHHSRPKVCFRACGTCCVRCKCVPPGTSGNREVCGKCYTDMTTHGNKTKCP